MTVERCPVPLQRYPLPNLPAVDAESSSSTIERQSGMFMLTSSFEVSRVCFRLRQRSRCRLFSRSHPLSVPIPVFPAEYARHSWQA